jgi:DNA-binding transcriptional MerR regulator/methylmalonyl-CoA mutase cobalamin-binding subunit
MRGRHPAAMQSDDPDFGRRQGGPYRIHAVSALTGVPEPTLRAWERRYGVPTPERTPSGYRLYGEREVAQVREMQRLCAEGMAAAEAARAVAEESTFRATAARGEVEPYAQSVNGILDAIERFDDVELDRQLRRAMFLGSTGAVADRVILPALERIGGKWHDGEFSIAQEHFGSHRLGTTMRDLVRLSVREDAEIRTVVACFADEDHDIGALAAAMRLATWGLRPIFLGARTPPDAVRSAVETLSPSLVALSVSIPPPRPRARELVDAYASACKGVPWMVGGAGAKAVARLVKRAGGLIAPEDTDQLHALVRRAIASAETRPSGGGS